MENEAVKRVIVSRIAIGTEYCFSFEERGFGG
jgi:hypothetical protein